MSYSKRLLNVLIAGAAAAILAGWYLLPVRAEGDAGDQSDRGTFKSLDISEEKLAELQKRAKRTVERYIDDWAGQNGSYVIFAGYTIQYDDPITGKEVSLRFEHVDDGGLMRIGPSKCVISAVFRTKPEEGSSPVEYVFDFFLLDESPDSLVVTQHSLRRAGDNENYQWSLRDARWTRTNSGTGDPLDEE